MDKAKQSRRCEICLDRDDARQVGEDENRPIMLCQECRIRDAQLDTLYGPWREEMV